MKIYQFLKTLTLIVLMLTSCSSSKDIFYMQDLEKLDKFSYDYSDYLLKPDDILKIDVKSEEPLLAKIFNPTTIDKQVSTTKETLIYEGYIIDRSGYIVFPQMGKIKVSNLTINQVREIIYDYITKNKILTNPFIDVKLLNARFTIIGEVNRPGRYDFINNNLNLLEAIGIAGDLTINGKRNDISVIRNNGSENKIYKINLTNSDFLKSDVFQINSGDIIIVNPNTSRVKNAGIIGNSGTLLSLLSFLLSTIIVTTSN